MSVANFIKLYADTTRGCVFFDNSRIKPKFLGTVTAELHPTQLNRIIVRRTDRQDENGDDRILLSRCNERRITDKDGTFLVDDLSYTTQQVVDYINAEGAKLVNEVTTEQELALDHLRYDPASRKLITDRAIETTLNSLFLGQQHKMSSGSENIFFTNLTSDINFFPMWGGLKDQSITANRDGSGFIPPSGRVYTDMFSLPLGGSPDPLTSTGYSGNNYFGINITGLGITTTAAEEVDSSIRLEYRITISGRQVYMQVLPRASARSSAAAHIYPNDVIEWFFDHPVDVRAGTTLFAEIVKVRISDDADLGVFQVRQGDTVDPNTGLLRYQATVHNRLFEDKDIELISPYLKYAAMDFGLDPTGATILLRDLSLGADSLLIPHPVNTLQAVANGTNIQIKAKDGQKIMVESLPVSGVSINGTLVNSVLNLAVTQLNDLFSNALTFASQGNPVTDFVLSGNDLTITLNDGTSYTTDVTTLGVDTNNFVASGVLSGSDLVLTMDDATTVTVDASSLAVDENTTISFGSLVGNTLTLTASDSSTVTIDVTSLAVDTNLYVVSGTLNANGIDLELTMSDASVITVGVGGLAIDNDTIITGGTVVGTDIQLSLNNGSIITIDATTLATGSSTNVVSGSVVGTDLILVMSDASEITIDASNMVSGSSLSATNDKWFISYGTNANTEVAVSTNDSTVNQQLPFYFGQALTQGDEFKWNFQSNGGANLILGIWDGPEVATAYNGGSVTQSNWNTAFTYAGGFIAGSNTTLTNTTNGTKYVVGTGDALALRFDELGFLTLVDISVSPEVEIAKTTIALAVTSFNVQMHTWSNGVLPNGIISTKDWTIVHDFDNSEAGIVNGIEDHTIIKSNISIVAGEKIMFMLDEVGQGDFFGTNYTGASSGVSTAEEQLDNIFIYQTNEAIVFDTSSGVSDWNANTNATSSSGGYFYSASLNQYRDGGGAGTIQGMFSLRFTDNGDLTLYDEDKGHKIATAKQSPAPGSSVSLYFGVKGNRAYYSIPVISKQTIGQGSQPDLNFVPTIADQTVTVTEGDALNFQIVSSDNIVNQYVELDAPSWMILNQNTGVLSGTAPAFLGTSADTIVVNCKAGNAIGGTVEFTITVTVAEIVYTNSNSLNFTAASGTVLQGNPSDVTVLRRAANGSGASDAWTISMWMKPSSSTNTETLFYYGGTDVATDGQIAINQFGGGNISFVFGQTNNLIAFFGVGTLPLNQWNHILVTYDGGTTGVNSADIASYITRFTMSVNGANAISQVQQTGNGYDGDIKAEQFKIGKYSTSSPQSFDGRVNQIAIWDTDESANLATIYNSGATQDLSQLASAPVHYYEIETSVTTIADIAGSADLVGVNFSSADLVTDTP